MMNTLLHQQLHVNLLFTLYAMLNYLASIQLAPA